MSTNKVVNKYTSVDYYTEYRYLLGIEDYKTPTELKKVFGKGVTIEDVVDILWLDIDNDSKYLKFIKCFKSETTARTYWAFYNDNMTFKQEVN